MVGKALPPVGVARAPDCQSVHPRVTRPGTATVNPLICLGFQRIEHPSHSARDDNRTRAHGHNRARARFFRLWQCCPIFCSEHQGCAPGRQKRILGCTNVDPHFRPSAEPQLSTHRLAANPLIYQGKLCATHRENRTENRAISTSWEIGQKKRSKKVR